MTSTPDIFNRSAPGTLHACDEPQPFTRTAMENFAWICRGEQMEPAVSTALRAMDEFEAASRESSTLIGRTKEFPTAEDAGMVRGEMLRRAECPLETPGLCRADLSDGDLRVDFLIGDLVRNGHLRQIWMCNGREFESFDELANAVPDTTGPSEIRLLLQRIPRP